MPKQTRLKSVTLSQSLTRAKRPKTEWAATYYTTAVATVDYVKLLKNVVDSGSRNSVPSRDPRRQHLSATSLIFRHAVLNKVQQKKPKITAEPPDPNLFLLHPFFFVPTTIRSGLRVIFRPRPFSWGFQISLQKSCLYPVHPLPSTCS